MRLLEGLDTFVVGALRVNPHPTHFNLEEAIAVAEQLKPKRTLLTHVSHDLDHPRVNQSLPNGIKLAYDGLRVPLEWT
jgi:phosphoribosyl 1,2-cyclic phosphate phosphodiesterase